MYCSKTQTLNQRSEYNLKNVQSFATNQENFNFQETLNSAEVFLTTRFRHGSVFFINLVPKLELLQREVSFVPAASEAITRCVFFLIVFFCF